MGSSVWQAALDHGLLREVDALVEMRIGSRLVYVDRDGSRSGGGEFDEGRLAEVCRATGKLPGLREGWASAPIRIDEETVGFVAARRGEAQDGGWLVDVVDLAARMVSLLARAGASLAPPVEALHSGGLVGRSPAMLELLRILDKVSDSESTVLIQGENGSGKEVVARQIHARSRRRARRFVAQNCSALNDNLLDSELFGHRRGAFTGAVVDRPGLLEAADGGTFFLDEVGDMSPALQVKLLRVLQEGTFTPVGDSVERTTDARIIAATHRDLKRLVGEGRFREDLYYRINVIHVDVPPLRQRREDLPLLVDHFLRRQALLRRSRPQTLAPECLDRFLAHDWPGNVRELENEIERLVVLAGDEPIIEEKLLSPRMRRVAPPPAASLQRLAPALDSLEHSLIHEALLRHGWNKTRAAAELGISRRNLIRKVEKHGLDALRRR